MVLTEAQGIIFIVFPRACRIFNWDSLGKLNLSVLQYVILLQLYRKNQN